MSFFDFNYKIVKYNYDEVDELEIMSFVDISINNEGFIGSHFTEMKGNYMIGKSLYFLKDNNNKNIGLSCIIEYLEENGDIVIYLMMISIHPDYKRLGLGSYLLNYIINTNNQSDIWVKINRNNNESKHFFKKHGFKKTTKRNMSKRLNPSYRTEYDPYVIRSNNI